MRKVNNYLLVILLAMPLMLVTVELSVLGQGRVTGTISGIVKDQTDALIQSANVLAKNTETGIKQETITNSEGYYRLDFLPVGAYSISIEAQGFKKSVNDGIKLSVNDILKVDFKLETGLVSEIVTVSEAASIVNTESSTLGKVVDNRYVSDLPVLSGAVGEIYCS